MNRVLEYFKTITQTPRCSFKTDFMQEKIIEISKELGYEVSVDKSGNILCKKGNPKVCLQAHYDMVCLGDVANIELVEDNGILKAKNSTLGADNGMGMSIMFTCMEKFTDLECLFTNDEEVGLIGASNLDLQFSSSCLLNLDGEEEKEIYIGCAGGIDVISTRNLEYLPLKDEEFIYEVGIFDLSGGHSGVDIDKRIDCATKVLAAELIKHDCKLLHIEGGELRNSIAKNAKAVIATCKEFKAYNSALHVKKIEHKKEYIKDGVNIIKALHSFAQGVRSFDKSYMIPSTSINLGVLRITQGVLKIDCSARAMKNSDLVNLAYETESFFQLIGCETSQKDGHEPWVPDVGTFANIVKKEMSKVYDDANFCAIHAGLECGILMQRQSKKIEAVAIGPTIKYPHSLREECDLSSVERISKVVENIVEGL
ncbi:M20/M25/M40 family metallo-hydrolase [Sulfurospirillum arcachonense]|uniref:M20/M25/M40 family metallo-hydrolase n=1 Tax=Sulfurospirillum arcachonense TaxID=57666 RepID=UPI00046A8B7A|nr:M20/M25/M40 family metallo-hydrolase [Sulfurospirillum arcachonense]